MTTLGIVRQAAGACLFGMALQAHAASLQISPVILNLDGAERAASMTLRNEGAEPIYGQVRVYAWSQTTTEDVLQETTDLAASPAIGSRDSKTSMAACRLAARTCAAWGSIPMPWE